MSPEPDQLILNLLAAIIPSIIVYLLGRRKTNAEIEEIRTDTAKKLVDSYGELVDDLQEQIERLENKQREVHQLQEKVEQLIRENHSQRSELARAETRIGRLEAEVDRLRIENNKLGTAAECLRNQVLDRPLNRGEKEGRND